MATLLPGADPWAAPGKGEREGTGIVVLHGLTGNPRTSTPFAKVLNAQGFTVDVPRLPGHGTTWEDMALTSYRDWRDEAALALERLMQSCDRVFVTGLSMGGTIAIDLAWERPADIAGIIPINAPVMPRKWLLSKVEPVIARLLKSLSTSAAGMCENDSARPFDEMAYNRVPLKAAQSLLDQLPRIQKGLSEIRVPVLVAYSPEDHTVPSENSQELLNRVPGAEAVVLANSYHLATVDLDADLLEERTVEFIDRISKAG